MSKSLLAPRSSSLQLIQRAFTAVNLKPNGAFARCPFIALVAALCCLGAMTGWAQSKEKDKDKNKSSTRNQSKSSTKTPTPLNPGATNQMVGVKFLGLSIVEPPADTGELTIAVDYQYDGAAGGTVKLVPVIGRTRANPPEFRSEEATISPGRGRATFKIAYAPSTPKAVTTDTITIWAFARGAHTIPSVRPFTQEVSWGRAATAKGSKPAEPIATTETTEPAPPTPPPPAPAKTVVAAKEDAPKEKPPVAEAPKRTTEAPKPKPATDIELPAGALTASQSSARPAWLQRLTLGPGDVLNLSLYGEPELSVMEASVGPDGRVSYLEAQDVLAAGLTVDEFRLKLDEELGKYRRSPRTIVSPVAYRSKKYFVMGHVVERGVFTLDRPLTIVEAVAQARGLEVGLRDGRMAELADFSRSFLARGGERVTVNFEKLFMEGDLSQNAMLEPGDYLYFPPSTVREIYVLGEVARPGVVTFNADSGALNAITERGGFTPRAWNRKVLVVRGSLTKPEAFIVDARAVLSARQADFPLKPRDIIYVSPRPWIKAEELLDEAATAFVQGVVITWTGGNIGSLLR